MRRERGQASVELVAALPLLLLAGLAACQLFAVGYAWTVADGAAEAGALALASGSPVRPAVREALPGWADAASEVAVGGGRVTVRLRPPAFDEGLGERLAVASTAVARARR